MGNVCSECGHPVSEDALFCSQCGNRLARSSDRGAQTVSGYQARGTIAGRDIVNSTITYGDSGELIRKINLDWLDTSLMDTHVKNNQALFTGFVFLILGSADHLASLFTLFGVEASTVKEFYAQLGWFKYLLFAVGCLVAFTSVALQTKKYINIVIAKLVLRDGKIMTAKVRAKCPECDGTMRVSMDKGLNQEELVCSRNPHHHRLGFDHTVLDNLPSPAE